MVVAVDYLRSESAEANVGRRVVGPFCILFASDTGFNRFKAKNREFRGGLLHILGAMTIAKIHAHAFDRLP